MHVLQFAEAKQLQRESAARLNGFIDELRSGGKVDLSAKNLGEEGTAYIAEGLAFNDRFVADANETVLHPGPVTTAVLNVRLPLYCCQARTGRTLACLSPQQVYSGGLQQERHRHAGHDAAVRGAEEQRHAAHLHHGHQQHWR
jgi:hypothetical protein